ncbi:MAG TPA: HIT family protein [Candidatus Woesearchaeota archaeon]|nr:HIT family protein [Candidatus Woesearchaeota archaeon]
MSEKCIICDRISEGLGVVYSDNDIAIIIPPEIVCDGHLFVTPIKHHSIFENLPDDVCANLCDIANKASLVLVDALKCTGTNLLVQSGKPAGQKFSHTGISIIPRFDNDNLNLVWTPRSLSEEDFSMVELKLKNACGGLFVKKEESKKVFSEGKTEIIDSSENKENLMIKHLDRIP